MPRPLLYALLALIVPLPAFALDGTGTPAGPVNFGVSASLGGCGLADTSIVCEIDASWEAVDGADYYSVSVTRPDGSVVDYGQTGGGGASLWVPYVGSGGYGVQVTAWGTPPGEEEPEVIAHDQADTTSSVRSPVVKDAQATLAQPEEAEPADGEVPVQPGEELPEEPPAEESPEEAVPPAEPPVCEETGEPEIVPAPAPAPAEGEANGEFSAEAAAAATRALEAQAELPESVTCP